jgi:hypothetical protein
MHISCPRNESTHTTQEYPPNIKIKHVLHTIPSSQITTTTNVWNEQTNSVQTSNIEEQIERAVIAYTEMMSNQTQYNQNTTEDYSRAFPTPPSGADPATTTNIQNTQNKKNEKNENVPFLIGGHEFYTDIEIPEDSDSDLNTDSIEPCVICRCNVPAVVLNCGHMSLCKTCIYTLRKTCKKPTCPNCRKKIETAIIIVPQNTLCNNNIKTKTKTKTKQKQKRKRKESESKKRKKTQTQNNNLLKRPRLVTVS